MPLSICQGHQGSAKGAHPGRVRVLTPESSRINILVNLSPWMNGSGWTDHCGLIESVVLGSTMRPRQARRVSVTEKANQRAQVRQGASSRRYESPEKVAYHLLVPQPPQPPSWQPAHGPGQQANGGIDPDSRLTPSWRDFAGPKERSQVAENSQRAAVEVNTSTAGGLTPPIFGRGEGGGSETLELLESRRRFENEPERSN